MTKKKKIVISTVVFSLIFLTLALLLHFIFVASKDLERKDPEIINVGRNYNYKELESYIIEEKEDDLIVINKSTGFSFSAPSSWKLEKKTITTDEKNKENILIFTSPDYIKGDSLYPSEGCKMHLAIYQEENYYQHLKQKINDITKKDEKTELIEISGIFGVIYETENKIIIRLPEKENIYEVGLYTSPEDKDCKNIYYSLLETIVLNHD